MDILKPIVPLFEKENPGVNINGCKECIIDMLRWAIKELKDSEPKPEKPEDKKK